MQLVNRKLQKIYKLNEETIKRIRIVIMDG